MYFKYVCLRLSQLTEKKQYGVDGDTRIDYRRPLPRPFTKRPGLATRIFVRGNARRIMKPLLKELRTSAVAEALNGCCSVSASVGCAS